MNEIKLKGQYCVVMAVFTIVNLTLFIHSKNWLLSFSKIKYNEVPEDINSITTFVLLTLAASIANIYALKECKRENIKSFLILTVIDSLSLVLSVALVIAWDNFRRPEPAGSVSVEPMLLLALYSIKSIAFGFFWYKKTEQKRVPE
jgi:hypothetical protein